MNQDLSLLNRGEVIGLCFHIRGTGGLDDESIRPAKPVYLGLLEEPWTDRWRTLHGFRYRKRIYVGLNSPRWYTECEYGEALSLEEFLADVCNTITDQAYDNAATEFMQLCLLQTPAAQRFVAREGSPMDRKTLPQLLAQLPALAKVLFDGLVRGQVDASWESRVAAGPQAVGKGIVACFMQSVKVDDWVKRRVVTNSDHYLDDRECVAVVDAMTLLAFARDQAEVPFRKDLKGGPFLALAFVPDNDKPDVLNLAVHYLGQFVCTIGVPRDFTFVDENALEATLLSLVYHFQRLALDVPLSFPVVGGSAHIVVHQRLGLGSQNLSHANLQAGMTLLVQPPTGTAAAIRAYSPGASPPAIQPSNSLVGTLVSVDAIAEQIVVRPTDAPATQVTVNTNSDTNIRVNGKAAFIGDRMREKAGIVIKPWIIAPARPRRPAQGGHPQPPQGQPPQGQSPAGLGGQQPPAQPPDGQDKTDQQPQPPPLGGPDSGSVQPAPRPD